MGYSHLTENELAKVIVDIAYHIHTTLGPGLFESVYEEIMCYELAKRGYFFERQKPISVYWDDLDMGIGFRADIIVERKVVVELKSKEMFHPVDFKQVMNYLKLTDLNLGLLINFNEALIKNGVKRVVNGL
jgi:GxxExxY protein